MARDVCLRDPDGSFYDPEDGFHVVRHEVVPLPDRICRLTEQALNKGILVDAKKKETGRGESGPPNTSEGSEEPVTTDEPAEVPGQAAPAPSRRSAATKRTGKKKAETAA